LISSEKVSPAELDDRIDTWLTLATSAMLERCGFDQESLSFLRFDHEPLGEFDRHIRGILIDGVETVVKGLEQEHGSEVELNAKPFLARFIWQTYPPCSQPMSRGLLRLCRLIACGELTEADFKEA